MISSRNPVLRLFTIFVELNNVSITGQSLLKFSRMWLCWGKKRRISQGCRIPWHIFCVKIGWTRNYRSFPVLCSSRTSSSRWMSSWCHAHTLCGFLRWARWIYIKYEFLLSWLSPAKKPWSSYWSYIFSTCYFFMWIIVILSKLTILSRLRISWMFRCIVTLLLPYRPFYKPIRLFRSIFRFFCFDWFWGILFS